jgi:hypothetical protein
VAVPTVIYGCEEYTLIKQYEEELIHLTQITVSCRIYKCTTKDERTPEIYTHHSNTITVENGFK